MNQPPQPPAGTLGDGCSLNYLHYGSALDDLPSIIHRFKMEKSVCKKDVMTYLQSLKSVKERQLRDLVDVVGTFGGIGQLKLNIDDFNHAVEESLRWRLIFRSLGCRGFSFRLYKHPEIHHVTFKSHVNIRIALAVDPLLYYPPKARDDLKRIAGWGIHLPRGIGWVLGTERRIDEKRWWLVLNIQSDLMSKPRSPLKEHFRGWQRILFRLLIVLAHHNDVPVIAIPSATTVAQACVNFPPARVVPENWRALYDGTAKFFGMEWINLRQRTDLQILWYRRAVWCSEFFVGDVSKLSAVWHDGCDQP